MCKSIGYVFLRYRTWAVKLCNTTARDVALLSSVNALHQPLFRSVLPEHLHNAPSL